MLTIPKTQALLCSLGRLIHYMYHKYAIIKITFKIIKLIFDE